jgi:hypothetical protein
MANQGSGRNHERDPAYHASHAARAMEIVRELHSAGRKLRPADIKRCEAYATDVFGHRKYAPWLIAYTAVSGSFKEGWIPDNFYGEKVVPRIQGPYGRVSLYKSLSPAFLDSPAFPDLGVRINGALFDTSYRPLSIDEARARFFEGAGQIVFKGDGSGRGKAIHFLDSGSFDEQALAPLGSGVIQRRVVQHGFFDGFFSKAVASVRITTVVEPSGEIRPRGAYLCIAIGSDTHVQSHSRIRVPLDVATGALSETGLLANWTQCTAHPTSGESFAGKAIPAFKKCLRTVISHHQRVPFIGAVGWDVTVGPDEQVQILEWNGFHNGIGFSEATQGPCFRGLGWEAFG